MHMPNELLSVPVAGGCFAVSAVCIGAICKSAEKSLSQEKIPLMGILGAFIFAAQMLNFPLPFPPGASGHLTGAVFLAIVIGPWAGSIVMTSVIIVQCLIFQDGGLLALGGNIINMALLPSFLGYGVYRFIAPSPDEKIRLYAAGIIASVIATVAAAGMVSVEAGLSGVVAVPFRAFLGALCGIHLVIGVIEGAITAALLVYLHKVRPDIIDGCRVTDGVNKKVFFATAIVVTLVIGTCFSLLASDKPDGLEFSLAGGESGTAAIENDSPTIEAANNLHEGFAPLPDYSRRISAGTGEASNGWTSFAAVVGSIITMLGIWVWAKLIRHKEPCGCTMR